MLTDVRNGVSLRFMRNTEYDMSLLLRWLTNTKVLQYVYGEGVPWDIDKIKEKFSEKTTDESTIVACLILYQEREVGYVQYYPIEEDSYKFNDSSAYERIKDSYGIDMFIGEPEFWKKVGFEVIDIIEDYDDSSAQSM